MKYKMVICKKCNASFEVEEALTSYSCRRCNAIHVGDRLSEPAGVDAPSPAPSAPPTTENVSQPLQEPTDEFERLNEAEQYKLQAEFILHALQANMSVYGSNSALTGCIPADVDLALKYINRSLELFPDNPAYLNLKALFLMEGKGQREAGIALLERAHKLNPRDITIEDNLNKAKQSSGCFIATAAYGTPDIWQVRALRAWRDDVLIKNNLGRRFVTTYYRFSPPVAGWIERHEVLRGLARLVLFPITRPLSKRYRQRARRLSDRRES